MREDDLLIVAELEQASHAAPWTQGNFRDAFAAGYGTLVGDLDGRIVAYGVLMLAPGEAQLLNLTVAEPARRRGLGRRLLQRLLDDAIGVGAEQCFLEVRESNHAAIALYLREGFAPVARRAAYYPPPAGSGRREDALVMRRRLGTEAHG
jgi:ribosomal-protein-alanine acetyltransferase